MKEIHPGADGQTTAFSDTTPEAAVDAPSETALADDVVPLQLLIAEVLHSAPLPLTLHPIVDPCP